MEKREPVSTRRVPSTPAGAQYAIGIGSVGDIVGWSEERDAGSGCLLRLERGERASVAKRADGPAGNGRTQNPGVDAESVEAAGERCGARVRSTVVETPNRAKPASTGRFRCSVVWTFDLLFGGSRRYRGVRRPTIPTVRRQRRSTRPQLAHRIGRVTQRWVGSRSDVSCVGCLCDGRSLRDRRVLRAGLDRDISTGASVG
jgi:hypothetical protein